MDAWFQQHSVALTVGWAHHAVAGLSTSPNLGWLVLACIWEKLPTPGLKGFGMCMYTYRIIQEDTENVTYNGS